MALEVSSAVPSLDKLLKGDWGMDKTVKGELWNLQAELSSMHDFLDDVSSMPPSQLESSVMLRVPQVRELSCAIETRLHSFMEDTFLPGASKRKINHEIATYIKETLIKFMEMHQQYGPYPCRGSLHSTSTWDPGMFAMSPGVSESSLLVGMEGPIAELTNKLSKGDHVSIVGMGGMGKTTLAQAVYGEMKTKGGFDCEAFVFVGLRADMKKVLTNIFDKLHIDIYGHEPDQHQQISQLQNFLVDKRCLFVIDDIWDMETCCFVERVLKGGVGSKLITTTRNLNIAKGVGGVVYTLRPLHPVKAYELLRAKAGAERYEHQFVMVPDKRMLLKCGGVPIAIIMIGRVFVRNQFKGRRRCVGCMSTGRTRAFRYIRKVLSYSFYDLPYNIKQCFLYLSLFPEDHWIEKNMLIWRWVAEGLVPDGLFETGETYFNELLDRCMIQWAVSPLDPSQGGCRVHVLMLDLIRHLSSSENVSTVIGINQQESTSQTGSIHRLAIHKGQNQNTSLEVGDVLSLYACAGSSLPPLRRFKRLRVIDLESCDLSVRDCNL
ncbi:hypothetical protein CFC21_032153 [Triticum aestivum]|uniref:NB-ARC domain-containing protein n=2 Tax=Triticum aestivum TaxID=4565 RepID=A0A9R1EYU8_WHEAT|nr:hypothetical protein CFC21_032153 [Triticum aestivum]